MKDTIRKIVVGVKKVPKSILVVTNTARMRPKMEEIRALGHECTLTENIGEAMDFLRAGERVNVVVVDLASARNAEKLTLWIKESRPGVRTICVNTVADLSEVPRIIHGILGPANPQEAIK